MKAKPFRFFTNTTQARRQEKLKITANSVKKKENILFSFPGVTSSISTANIFGTSWIKHKSFFQFFSITCRYSCNKISSILSKYNFVALMEEASLFLFCSQLSEFRNKFGLDRQFTQPHGIQWDFQGCMPEQSLSLHAYFAFLKYHNLFIIKLLHLE